MWLVIGQTSQADQSDLLLVFGKLELHASYWCEGQPSLKPAGSKAGTCCPPRKPSVSSFVSSFNVKIPSTTYLVVFPSSLKLLLYTLLRPASVSIKKAYWFWNPWKTETSWKHFQLELGMMDKLDFRDTIWMIQLPFEVNQNLEKTKSKQFNFREIVKQWRIGQFLCLECVAQFFFFRPSTVWQLFKTLSG